MPQSGSIALPARTNDSRFPLAMVAAVVLLVAVVNVVSDPFVSLAALVGIIGVVVVSTRPAYAVTLLLGSFLVTYPWWLQGRGFLTLNNILGAWLGILMVYRLFRNRDWSMLQNREMLLMVAIAGVFLLSRVLHRPDDHTMELVTPLIESDQDPARVIINRLIFFVFLVYFVRTPEQVRLLFLLALGMMIASGFAAISYVLIGRGFAGYRARSGLFIQAAGNPNRLALAAIISIVSLWYLTQWLRNGLVTVVASILIAVEVLAVFMTGSRSGVTAFALATGILFLDGGVSPRKLVIGIIAGLAAMMLIVQVAPEQSLERISNIPGTESSSDLGAGSVQRRGYTAALAVEFAQRNPLIGVGIGNWEITRYLSDPVHNIAPPHSSVLMALAEGGLITLGFYVVLLIRTLRNFIDTASILRDTQPGSYLEWMAKSLRASFLVFLALSLVGDLWLNILFYWFVGLGVTLSRCVLEPQLVRERGAEPALAQASA